MWFMDMKWLYIISVHLLIEWITIRIDFLTIINLIVIFRSYFRMTKKLLWLLSSVVVSRCQRYHFGWCFCLRTSCASEVLTYASFLLSTNFVIFCSFNLPFVFFVEIMIKLKRNQIKNLYTFKKIILICFVLLLSYRLG